jgi:hypothetical protein
MEDFPQRGFIKCRKSSLHVSEIVSETLNEESIGRFYDNSKGKIGKQKLGNNIQFMSALRIPWNGEQWSNDKIRIELKKVFFTYYNITI